MKAVTQSNASARRPLTARAATGLLALLCSGLAMYASPLRAADPASTDSAVAGQSDSSSVAAPPGAAATSTQPQVTVAAPEPRFVAPTRRDRIGRIWAPVFIDGKGPFRLALDSCADTSGITKRVAQALGLSQQNAHHVVLHGGLGIITVPEVPVTTFNVGDISGGRTELPIVPDALGGADGVLGVSRMGGRRIMVDFRHDLITITRSRGQPAPAGYLTIPFVIIRPQLVVVDAKVGSVPAKAIIDTGSQGSIANFALKNALEKWRLDQNKETTRIEDVTRTTLNADSADSPPITIAIPHMDKGINIANDRLTFADMKIFTHWQLAKEPTVLIGMNTLGQFDVMIIDYQRKELQLLMRGAPPVAAEHPAAASLPLQVFPGT